MADSTLAFNVLAKDNASGTFKKIGKSAEDTGRKFGFLAARSHGLTAGMTAGFGKIVAGLGAIATVSAFTGFINDARESAKVGRLTEQVIKSTGKAAHISADQVGSLATSISNKTGADDEAIQSGENLLLTFTNIRNEVGKGNDIFNQASSMITDMTAALNNGEVTAEGMKASSIQLGKALNDPIKGVSALQKVGVSFTQQQKDQIKTLVESGNTLGAQKIILGELNKEFGGAAAAASDPLTKLKTILGNVSEQIGGFFLPAVDKAATFLGTKAVPAVSALANTFAAKVGPRLREFGGFLGVEVLPKIKELAGFVKERVIPALAELATKIGAALAPILSDMGQKIKNEILPALKILGVFLVEKVVPALGSMADFVKRNKDFFIPFAETVVVLVAGLKAWAIVQGILNAVLAANPIGLVVIAIAALVAGLIYAYKHSEKFRAIVDGAFNAVKVGATAVIDFFKNNWKNLPLLLLGPFGIMIFAFKALGPNLTNGLKAGLLKGLTGIGSWLKNHLVDPVVNAVKRLFGISSPSTVFSGIGWQLIAGLLSGILKKIAGIGTWLYNNVILPIVRRFNQANQWLVDKGKSIIAGLLSGLGTKWTDVATWIGKRRESVLSWIGNSLNWLKQKGRDVLQGFWEGLLEKWRDVTKWVGGIATWIKDHKGPVSLDRILLKPAGLALMKGFLDGLKSGAGAAWDFVSKVGGKSRSALEATFGAIQGMSGNQNVAIGKNLANARGWFGSQWDALYNLWMGESGWNNLADNPNSTAFGIPQFLNGTARQYGVLGVTDPTRQIIAGMQYIADAYGTPENAWAKWQSRSPHWYEQGTPWVPNDQLAYLHRGEAVIPADVNRARLNGAAPAPAVIRIEAGPSALDRLLLEVLRRSIKNQGGNVQVVLGT